MQNHKAKNRRILIVDDNMDIHADFREVAVCGIEFHTCNLRTLRLVQIDFHAGVVAREKDVDI